MTKEKAREIIYKQWQCFLEENIDYAGISEAYKMALKALEAEPCEDAISRAAVLDIWHTTYSDNREENEEIQYKKIAFELPSVTPLSKTGHWVKTKDGYHRCDRCGSRGSAIKARYCHHCGVRMEEQE